MSKSISKEIGSEFSTNHIGQQISFKLPDGFNHQIFTFCGRTSIDAVISVLPNVKKVLLPSYCCDSMIEPFRKKHIKVIFYDVNYFDELRIDLKIEKDIDLILWCNYFGYKKSMPNLGDFIKCGGIVVEDITHSLFSVKQYHRQSHFLVASLRKWGPLLSGGICISNDYDLSEYILDSPDEMFVATKKRAMSLKEKYLSNTGNCDKEKYLDLFHKCNKWISTNYANLKMDDESQSTVNGDLYNKVVEIRRRNARVLYRGLKDHPDISFLFDINKMDCPIFVPIIVKNNNRERFRKILIENNIYCPIHWPRPNDNCQSNLYDCELSLICDQRYNVEDMQKIVNVLNNLKENINLKKEGRI